MNMFDNLFGEALEALDNAVEAIIGTTRHEPIPTGYILGTSMSDEWIDDELNRMFGKEI